ncbi:MAG: GerMN domain-containing protein, partial [Eubacterium sp.]|nr:GerMN domain-containing protein [Eubacterium sp.]
MKKAGKWMLIALLLATVMSGCGSSDDAAAPIYRVYYLDANCEKLVSEEYQIQTEARDVVSVATELIHALEKNGEQDRLTNPIEPDIEFDELQVNEKQMSVYFTGAYNNKSGLVEVLSRAAIVKTLCQIDRIDKVDFYVEDQPLMISGENVGQMDETTFVEDLGNRGEPQSR